MARNDGFITPDDHTPARLARPGGSDDDFESLPRTRSAGSGTRAERDAARAKDDSEIDPRLLDLDVEEESPFLRAQKRVPVRRGPLPRKAADRLKIATLVLIGLGVFCVAAYNVYRYGATSWRFRIESGDDVQVAGLENVTHAQVMEVFGGDLGRNIFFVPLAERQRQLEQIPWVESATVMRLLPHQLRIQIKERTPVALVQVGSRIQLVDASGVFMELPRGQRKYSFPVLVGMSDAEPLSTRGARMKIYTRVITDLDREGARHSQDISEIDLRDPDDVKITVPDDAGAVLVHLGDTDFLARFKLFQSHVQEWRLKYRKLDSVDLRYEREVIVNPDRGGGVSATVNTGSPEAGPPADAKKAPGRRPASPAHKKAKAAPPPAPR